MFWGIIITIGVGTLFRSRWLLLLSVFLGAAYLWLTNPTPKIQLLWYFFGVVCACSALTLVSFRLHHQTPFPKQFVFSGLVVDQRSSDTRVVALGSGDMLVRSKQPLSPGEEISFSSSSIVYASVPQFSRTSITPPVFFLDDFSFDYRLATKSYIGRVSLSSHQLLVHTTHIDSLSFIQKQRATYKTYINHLFGNTSTAALILGLTTGDRSGFSRQIYTSFVESGLVHLLAVSGSNVVYISLLLGVVMFRIPFYIRITLIGMVLILYGFFCGADSSVVRAISMGILGLVATMQGRRGYVLRFLKITAGGMLLRNPLVLWYDLGFLLSFCAVGGILFVEYLFDSVVKSPLSGIYACVKSWLLPTFGATLGVFPILILWTGTVSLSSILVNLFVVPLVPVFLLIAGRMLLFGGPVFLFTLLDWMSSSLISLASWGTIQGLFFSIGSGFSRLLFVSIYILFFMYMYDVITSWQEQNGGCLQKN